jgi:hypothetical protein
MAVSQCIRESTALHSDYYSTMEKTATLLKEVCTRAPLTRLSTCQSRIEAMHAKVVAFSSRAFIAQTRKCRKHF